MATITVLNTSSNLSSKTLLAAENANTVTGLLTFSRNPSAPFAVSASSAVVTNLDADKLDGQDAPTGTIVGTSDSQTLTNKTISAPIFSGTATGTYTLGGTSTINNPTIVNAALSGTLSGTPSFSGALSFTATPLFTPSRSNGANATALSLTDAVTGVQTAGFGTQLRGLTNAGSGATAIGFEVGGTGTNNESQLSFYTQPSGASLARRWGIGYQGDLLFGASSHIALSSGTPSIAVTVGADGSHTVVGNDYAMNISGAGNGGAGGGATQITITYGHTFSSAPIVVAGSNALLTTGVQVISSTTTQAVINFVNSGAGAYAYNFNVITTGY